jgi:hypothetical protein
MCIFKNLNIERRKQYIKLKIIFRDREMQEMNTKEKLKHDNYVCQFLFLGF